MDLSVLVVDDDHAVGTVLVGMLERRGVTAAHESGGEAALQRLSKEPFDALIADVRMPGMSGLELHREVRRRWPDVQVILLTAYGTVPMAVQAIRDGASDFLLKPFEASDISGAVEKLKRRTSDVTYHEGHTHLIGTSEAMQKLSKQIAQIAPTDATVLIRGESGTGKELITRALHEQSKRSAEALISVHCGAIPEALLETELFGHERGAFTGAVRARPGRVEMARGGTLFLDEIGDVSAVTQVKLLRLLQERCYERVGGDITRTADVRFVAATHRDLEAMIDDETFRLDLFYRLNVVPLVAPPLRERIEDIPALVEHFTKSLSSEHRVPKRRFETSALEALSRHHWPGNVRELRNLVERLLILPSSSSVTDEDVRAHLGGVRSGPPSTRGSRGRPSELSREQLEEALENSSNNRALAARLLGVSRRTLYNRLQHFGMS